MDTTPLEGAHVRNQRVVQELRRLREESTWTLEAVPDWANYYPKLIANLQRVYTQMLATIDAVQFIGLEGVREVTLRSRTESITYPIESAPGILVADALLEYLRSEAYKVENQILEAKGRLAGEYTGGTTEEWHHENVHALALVLEAVPMLTDKSAQV